MPTPSISGLTPAYRPSTSSTRAAASAPGMSTAEATRLLGQTGTIQRDQAVAFTRALPLVRLTPAVHGDARSALQSFGSSTGGGGIVGLAVLSKVAAFRDPTDLPLLLQVAAGKSDLAKPAFDQAVKSYAALVTPEVARAAGLPAAAVDQLLVSAALQARLGITSVTPSVLSEATGWLQQLRTQGLGEAAALDTVVSFFPSKGSRFKFTDDASIAAFVDAVYPASLAGLAEPTKASTVARTRELRQSKSFSPPFNQPWVHVTPYIAPPDHEVRARVAASLYFQGVDALKTRGALPAGTFTATGTRTVTGYRYVVDYSRMYNGKYSAGLRPSEYQTEGKLSLTLAAERPSASEFAATIDGIDCQLRAKPDGSFDILRSYLVLGSLGKADERGQRALTFNVSGKENSLGEREDKRFVGTVAF